MANFKDINEANKKIDELEAEISGKRKQLDKETLEQRMEYHKLQKNILAAQGREIEALKQIGEAYEDYLKKNIDGFVDLKSATAEQKEEIKKKTETFQKMMDLEGQSIEEIMDKLKEMDRVFDEGTKAADDFGGSLARKLGMASHHSETFIGKMQKLNATLSDPKSRQAFAQRISEIFTFTNMAASLLSKITEATLAFAFGVDEAVAKFVSATGQTRQFTSEIRNAGGEMMQFGITAGDAGKSLATLFAKFPGTIDLTSSQRNELIKASTALERFGVSAETSATLMGSLTKTFKVSTKEAAKMVKDLAFAGQAIGKPISAMVAGFQEANKYLATYGKSSVDVYKKIASSAMAAGVEVSDLLALSKKFDTFSSSAETAARMNAVFGTNMSALNLVTMDVQDRMPYLVEQFKATGQEFDQMSRYAQLSAAQILGFGDDVEKARKILTMSTTQFAEYNEKQKEAAEQQKEYDQILKDSMPALLKLKMALMKLATVLAPFTETFNAFAQGVLDTAIYIRENLYPMLILAGIGLVAMVAFLAMGAKALMAKAGAAALATLNIGALATSIGGLSTALGALKGVSIGAGASVTVVGNAAATAGTRMVPLITALGALFAGVGLAAGGLAALALAFKEAGVQGLFVIPTILALGAALYFVLQMLSKTPPQAVLGAGVILAVGAAFALAALGVAAAVTAFGYLIGQFQTLNDIGASTVAVFFGLAAGVILMAKAFTLLGNPLAIVAILSFTLLLSKMADVADRVAEVTGNLAAIATGNVTAAFTAIAAAMDELDQKISGNVQLRATIEDLALISTGQSSNTISKGVDTTSAIQNAFKGLEKVFSPKINLTVELDGKELEAKIKKTTSKT